MAFSGVGEALSAPLFGCWSNRANRVNPPLLTSLAMSLFANLLFLSLNALPAPSRKFALLLSRFFSGAGSGNRATCCSFVAAASRMSDRSRAMTMVSGAAGLGITIGPAVQMVFTHIGDQGILVGPVRISIMYTAPALLAVAVNVASVLLLVLLFDDRLQEASVCSESDSDSAISDTGARHKIRFDLLAVSVCIFTRVIRMIVTANIESIGSPFSQIMFGFDEKEALHYNSSVQSVVAVLVFSIFLLYTCTDIIKYLSDRNATVIAIVMLLSFHLLTMSWPFLEGGPLDYCSLNGTAPKYSWCESLKPVNVYVYYLAYVFIFGLAVPSLNNSVQTLYSQVLGKGKQGKMQGINQAIGCASRILGPLLMSHTFTQFGPQVNWLIEIVVLAFCLAMWVVAYRRMIPFNPQKVRPVGA
uniref:Autophagy-related protein n=2 Tax=Steinernema glaseri TaxID=37863 RepID=A0A1I7YH60_9BILA